ncbi:receptor-type tyrosine-protein phosphatase H-like isoform X2 [Anoplopoma fimbria]|uniref:receptor-type tyrosine-protein phosphatase H-like isoform X2 n=1 Tax=Anoplopoma fimbria TaxID=229290 RepID=UPI0023EBBFBA|nr:receptor-type tyrosine-protein phosphatase H-like isoform X2 [Anoplopoma fimbria]
MKPLSFKNTSEHFRMCIFLILLWVVTDSSSTAATAATSSTTLKPSVSPSTTLPTPKPPVSPSTTLPTPKPPVSPSTTLPTTKPPPVNVNNVTVLTQNETSITLKWDKVNNITTYFLQYDNNEDGQKEVFINATDEEPSVKHVVTPLTAGRKYNFTLITVFEGVNSTGYTFQAVTAPENVKNVTVLAQNETSITLKWVKVNNITTYLLQYDNEDDVIDATDGATSVTHVVTPLTAGKKYHFTLITVFDGVKSTGYTFQAVTAPENVKNVTVLTQNETSITLKWVKVNNITTYFLQYDNEDDVINATDGATSVTHVVTPLTAGKKYHFTLITVFDGVKSTGYTFQAVTAPENVNNVTVSTQNETSITLKWVKVNNITTYFLQYDNEDDVIDATDGATSVTHVVTPLTAGKKYNFTLITVFDGVKSTGYTFEAVTAPRNTGELESIGQNETSITLQWKKVDDILTYTLVFNESVIHVTASGGLEKVNHTILELTSGTKYDFSLFTVFENIRSSGVNYTAVTAPGNVNNVTVLTQNETSITLQWKKVDDILTYTLVFNERMIHVTASGGLEKVNHTILKLTSGTKYDFSLFTVFENIRSSGVNYTAVTVPSMVTLVNVTERSVTSITLTWQNAKKDWEYSLIVNGENPQLLPNTAMDVVSHSTMSLQPGTAYTFHVITQFSGFNSTAYEVFTVTAIDCTKVNWLVTNSSIQGTIEGLFSNATAINESQTHVSPEGSNVSFSGLYPGATYEVSLVYKNNTKTYPQCTHSLTIIPPYLSAHCEYSAAGYSVFIVWDHPDGVWTSVEVNVAGETYKVPENKPQNLKISGFQPAKTYQVSLATLVMPLSGPIRKSEQLFFSCPTDPRGVIAGAVIAVVLFCLLVCLALFIFFKRPDIISRKKAFIGGSRQANKKIKAISVAKFPDHFYQLELDENRGFSQEYENLIPVGMEQTREAALLPQNKARNRFTNILPYDWCRVMLTTSNPNETSDYINASYMPGHNSNREYIATQGPLPSTVNEFWRMIWEQRVKGIVMVTNCTEGGRTKCELYWPANSNPCSYGGLLVTIRSEQQEANWTLREFRVKHRNNSEERTVKHFHFTAWPDHGVPQGTEVLIQFRGLVRQHIEREGAGAPTVVHCSAGVGRTGTIIALDVLLQQLDKERAVGINGFVHKMRLSRPHMVQTESQYVFLHQCIMDRLQPNEKNEENIYENAEMIYANATALREFKNA